MGHGIGILLLSAIGGYWVLERADRHKGGLRKTGQVLGAVIIAVSLLGVACKVMSASCGVKGLYPTSGMGKKGMCPISFGSHDLPSTSNQTQ